MKQFCSRLSGYYIWLASCSASAQDGIPQMDQTWYPNQLLWLAVSFALLYAAVSLFIAPRISAILATRETAIAEAIREAEEARSAAESISSNATSANRNSRIRAAEIMAQLQADSARDTAQAIAKLDHDLARKAAHARSVLDDVMKKAEAGIDHAAQDLAQAMTEKLLENQQTCVSDQTISIER